MLIGTKNLVNLKKYAFTNLKILSKKGARGAGRGCGTRMNLNFGGVWHKNDLDVKYTPLGHRVVCAGKAVGNALFYFMHMVSHWWHNQ